ncbi:MAG TPA: cadherin repeat domain-containing protein, partial [Balneolaceae bacterium]|nr:cadherin repeat domain-containing protein [Balneolaceae bacterium]
MKIPRYVLLILVLFIIESPHSKAQPVLQSDYSYSMKIPSVVAMDSSPAHMYILSNSDGMAVFRTRKDSLKWLYTASGMQHRGHSIRADIRFAYLFGKSHRLTVLEPTSVMGAYSSTQLPARPLDAVRIGENLYVALGSRGLGRLSLKTPDAVDSTLQKIAPKPMQGKSIIDLGTTPKQFYALSGNHQLFGFEKNDEGIKLDKKVSLGHNISRIFTVNDSLLASNKRGVIFTLLSNGSLQKLGSIGEPVQKIRAWKNWLIIKGKSGRLWTSYQRRKPTLWKKNADAGNYFTVSKGRLWLSEYDKISRVREVQARAAQADSTN